MSNYDEWIVSHLADEGASTDAVARLMAEQIGRAQGVTIVVENRPGASGMIGTERCRARRPTATRS